MADTTLPFKIKDELDYLHRSVRLFFGLLHKEISIQDYELMLNNLKIDRLRFKLDQRKNRINHPDPDNMLDGKQGRISVKFKWLDAVEENIRWHNERYYDLCNMRGAWLRMVQEDGN